jgi:hypothetical protein
MWWSGQEEWDLLGLELGPDVDNGVARLAASLDPTLALQAVRTGADFGGTSPTN